MSPTTDILTIVFNFVDKGQLPSCARVNKAWRDPALDELWKELPSVFPLFELLGSLIHENGGWVCVTFRGTLDQVVSLMKIYADLPRRD